MIAGFAIIFVGLPTTFLKFTESHFFKLVFIFQDIKSLDVSNDSFQ